MTNPIPKIRQFYDEVIQEVKKCTWPSRSELLESTIIVIVSLILPRKKYPPGFVRESIRRRAASRQGPHRCLTPRLAAGLNGQYVADCGVRGKIR